MKRTATGFGFDGGTYGTALHLPLPGLGVMVTVVPTSSTRAVLGNGRERREMTQAEQAEAWDTLLAAWLDEAASDE